MIVVTDASPLHYLVLMDAEPLLQKLYQQVVCPETVHRECCHPHAPEKLRRWVSNPPDWLHVISDAASCLPGLEHLDPGERAAIQTARSLGAQRVLMDEKKGRLAAEALGLVAVGVIGVIIEATRARLIEFEATIELLRTKTNFRVSDLVIERAREALKLRKPSS
jgi:predicted nucleic acid-binding protein